MEMESQNGTELCFPQLLNMSCRKPVLQWSHTVVTNIVLPIISVLTVALNLLVIISVSHFRQLHISSNFLILSLSVSDLLVGLVFLPGEVLRTACWYLGDVMCSVYKYVSAIAVIASVGDMVLISIDRYVAICDPMHYSNRFTVTRAKVCIFICWLYSAAYSNIFLKYDLLQADRTNSCHGQCVIFIDYISGMLDLVLTFIVPITIIVLLYMRVFIVAVSQARAMRSHIRVVKLQQTAAAVSKKSELKAARTLGVIVVVFLICFCPYYYAPLGGDALYSPSGSLVIYLFCLNPCLNPVIYALFYPWFRKAIKLIVTLQILQPGSSKANIL